MKMKNVKKQQGFTLIELVVVIVILGILAVTAAPKFINLQSDAHTATLQAIKASMESASTLVHSKSLIKGNENSALAADETVIVNSAADTVYLSVGYPISDKDGAGSGVPATDWALLLDVNGADFTIAEDAIDGYVVVYPAGRAAPSALPVDNDAPTALEDDCFTYYQETLVAGTKPTMDVVVCL